MTKGFCVRTTLSKLSPVGTAESSPARECWVSMCRRVVPQGRLKVTQDMGLGWLRRIADDPSPRWREPRTAPGLILTRPGGTGLAGHVHPALTCWAIFSRPCGTEFVS